MNARPQVLLTYLALALAFLTNLLVIAPLSGHSPALVEIPAGIRIFCGGVVLLGGAWLVMPPRDTENGQSGYGWSRLGAWSGAVAVIIMLGVGLTAWRAQQWRNLPHLQDFPYAEAPQQTWLNPERGLSVDRNALTVDGRIWARGIGSHAPSRLVFDVTGPCRLSGALGVDDETRVHRRGRLTGRILLNGEPVHSTEPVVSGGPPEWFTVDIPSGLNRLELVADSGEADHDDHADWLGLTLVAISG